METGGLFPRLSFCALIKRVRRKKESLCKLSPQCFDILSTLSHMQTQQPQCVRDSDSECFVLAEGGIDCPIRLNRIDSLIANRYPDSPKDSHRLSPPFLLLHLSLYLVNYSTQTNGVCVDSGGCVVDPLINRIHTDFHRDRERALIGQW